MGASGFTFVLGRRTRENHVSRWRGFTSAPSSLLLPCRGGTQSATHCLFSRLFISTCLFFFFLSKKCTFAFTSPGLLHRGPETAKGAQHICFHVGKVTAKQHQDEEEEEGEGVEEEKSRRGRGRRGGGLVLCASPHVCICIIYIWKYCCWRVQASHPALMEKKWDIRWEQDEGGIKTRSLNEEEIDPNSEIPH